MRCVAALAPAALLLATVLAAAALAAGLTPVVLEPTGTISPSGPAATDAICTLAPGPVDIIAYTWQQPDAFTSVAWRIPPCEACGPQQGLLIRTVSFRVRWVYECVATARVSVVGATAAGGCLVPDTSVVLSPLVEQVIGGAAQGVVYTVGVPEVCVDQPAFALIRFTGFAECTPPGELTPGITRSTASCVLCDQFFTTSPSHVDLTDWCSIGATNRLWVEVQADCCDPNPTPTLTPSWGRLKSTYR